MSTTVKTAHSDSMAIVPYRPSQSSQEFLRSQQERITNEVFRRSLEIAKFEEMHLIPLDLDRQIVSKARSRRLYQVLPPLSGPYSISHTEFIINPPKTTGDMVDNKIGVEIYAPTSKKTGNKLFMLRPNDNFGKIAFSSEQLHSLYSHSFDQMEFEENRPIIIFSHGLGVDPIQYRVLLENLVSHGNIVLCVNHPSSSGYAPFSEKAFNDNVFSAMSFKEQNEEADKLALIQANNIRYVIKQIRGNNLIKGLNPSNPIILVGHSLGGESSIIVANKDPHITGCVNLDGMAGDKETRAKGLKKTPVLTVSADHKPPDLQKDGAEVFEFLQQMSKDWETFHRNSDCSFRKKIDDIEHMDFCSYYPILDWLIGNEDGLKAALKTHIITSGLMLKFMKSIL